MGSYLLLSLLLFMGIISLVAAGYCLYRSFQSYKRIEKIVDKAEERHKKFQERMDKIHNQNFSKRYSLRK